MEIVRWDRPGAQQRAAGVWLAGRGRACDEFGGRLAGRAGGAADAIYGGQREARVTGGGQSRG